MKLFPTQKKFYLSEASNPAFVGGYGSGKTYIHTVKGITLALQNPGLMGLVVAPTYRDLRDTNIDEWQNLLTEFGILYTYNKSLYEMVLPWFGTKILFRSADDPERLKGPNVAWAGIDEIARIDEKIWGVLVSRVRHPRANKKQTFAVGTPEGLNWVYEKWVENPREGYELFQASSEENFLLGPEYIQSLLDSHDEDEIVEKLHGQFSAGVKGRIYKRFSRDEHVIEFNPFSSNYGRFDPALPSFVTCDFNIDPCVWLLGQHNPSKKKVYFFDEISVSDTDTSEMTELLLLKAKQYDIRHTELVVYGDPSGASRHTTGSKSDYGIIKEAGFKEHQVARSAPPVKDRIVSVNKLLFNTNANDDQISLFVHPSCKKLIADFEQVKWKKGAGTTIVDKSNLKLTHASDAAGYFIHKEYNIRKALASPVVRRKRIM